MTGLNSDQFDARHWRSVTLAGSELQDAGVSTIT
jgi:hypothetical protein